MREITRSVKVAVKCLIAVVVVDVDLPYWTSKVEHLVTFAAIVSKVLLRMRRNGYLGTSDKRFGDSATFYVDFWRFIRWMSFDSPTPISSQSAKFRRLGDVFHWFLHFISWKFAVFLLPVYFTYWAKFEVDMAIHCRVIAFLLLIRCVTLWPWLLTFWLWPAVIHGRSRDQHCQKVRKSYAYLFLSCEL